MTAQRNIHPDQLKLFMSPAEITAKYQPLDADRESDEWGDSDPYAYAQAPSQHWSPATARSTHQNEPDIRAYNATHATPTRGGGLGKRTGGGGLYRLNSEGNYYHGESGSSVESDEQLWERKAEEATTYGNDSGTGYQSLWESVESHGVKEPVHLGQQFGSSGMPQVVGGHHRIAAAMDTRPHDPIPVLHHTDIFAAKKNRQLVRRPDTEGEMSEVVTGYPYR